MPYEDFEYWMLPSTENEKTRIVRCYKTHKYIVFVRDDGKECKYDLSTGECIGFRGKPVKRLQGQLKDLTCTRLFEIIEDQNYKRYLEWVWNRYRKGKAWVFFEQTMPYFIGYEQYFASNNFELERRFAYAYNELPKGLLKLCNTYGIKLTNKLANIYIEHPNIFNLLQSMELKRYSINKMIEAIIYGCTIKNTDPTQMVVNPQDLTKRNLNPSVYRQKSKNSYFISLIDEFGYNAKLLMVYVDSAKIKKRINKHIFQEVYDYADMMNQLYDDFDKYPEDLKSSHARACKEYTRYNTDYDEREYAKRNVLDYECEIDGYKFIYPRSTEEIKDEAKQQHNCVATYINRVLKENCHIMFMRPIEDLEHSYITLEICDNRIVQARRKCNLSPSKEDREVIEKWNQKYKRFVLE